MLYTIHKGKHYAKPRRFGFYFGTGTFRYKVMFLPSCRYVLPNGDQGDWNKLVGISLVPWWKMFFIVAPLKLLGLLFNQHHKESARFGWRYNPENDNIELGYYCYVSKKRVSGLIATVKIGESAELTLTFASNHYFFEIAGANWGYAKIDFSHNNRFAYRLNPYFGGNSTALHDTKLILERL